MITSRNLLMGLFFSLLFYERQWCWLVTFSPHESVCVCACHHGKICKSAELIKEYDRYSASSGVVCCAVCTGEYEAWATAPDWPFHIQMYFCLFWALAQLQRGHESIPTANLPLSRGIWVQILQIFYVLMALASLLVCWHYKYILQREKNYNVLFSHFILRA